MAKVSVAFKSFHILIALHQLTFGIRLMMDMAYLYASKGHRKKSKSGVQMLQYSLQISERLKGLFELHYAYIFSH